MLPSYNEGVILGEPTAKVTARGVCLALVLLLRFPIPAAPLDASRGGSPGSGVVQTAHALVRAGQLEEARRFIHAAMVANPADPQLLCLHGDVLFRQSKFDEAEKAYRAALILAPRSARAHLGLARGDQLRFQRRSAREHIATAYQLDWRDPDIVLAYAHLVPDLEARKVLLGNVIALSSENKEQREDVMARLEMEERLGSRKPAVLESPYRDYKFPLETFIAPNGQASGVLLKVSINHGKPLRLILDTGADGVVITSKAVRNLALETLTRSQISGLGRQSPANAVVALAKTVEIGDFQLQDCVLQVSDVGLAPGADGIIGANVFQEFLIRLDARSRALALHPFEGRAASSVRLDDPWLSYDGPVCANCDQLKRVYRAGHLLLLRATLEGQPGYFLLDSGAAFSAVSQSAAEWPHGSGTNLVGARGPLDGASYSRPLRLAWGPTQLTDLNPVSLDLTAMNRQEGIEISGIIGFPALNKAVVTINYRDGLAGFAIH